MINYDENDNVILTFTKDEAIVLFEWVCNFNNKNPKAESFDDQAEQRVLWNIEADLEKELFEPFKANYNEILIKARENVRDKE